MRFTAVAFAGLLLLALPSCRHGPDVQSGGTSPPDWLTRIPQDNTMLYAVGMCGPTKYPKAALDNAEEDARAKLAETLKVEIAQWHTAETVSTGTGSGTQTRGRVSVLTADISDVVLECSEIQARWMDSDGKYSGTAGTAYALGRVDRSKAKSKLPK